MKSLLLILLAAVLATAPAVAQSKSTAPHPKRKAAFNHTEAGSAKNKANRARFRRDNHPVTLNLHPRDPERFTKAKANKEYHFDKPGEVAKPRKFKK